MCNLIKKILNNEKILPGVLPDMVSLVYIKFPVLS